MQIFALKTYISNLWYRSANHQTMSCGSSVNQNGMYGMSDLFYIIITSDSGKTRRIPVYKKRFILASFFFTLFLAGLIFSSSLTIGLLSTAKSYSRQIATLKEHLQHSTQLLAKHQEGAEQLKQQMALEIASLQMAKARQEASFSEEKEEILATAVTELN